MDLFSERMIKKPKTPVDTAIIVFTIVIAILVVFLLFTLYAVPPINVIAMPLQALAVFLAYKFVTSRNVEFEYEFTNGYLEVDKIINKQSRKHLADLDAKSIQLLVPYGDDRIPRVTDKNIINATDGTYDEGTYCIVFGDNEKKVLVFEPTEEMLKGFKLKNPRNVFLRN